MLLFPFIAGLASLLYVVALIIPTGVLGALGLPDGASTGMELLHYITLFMVYLGLAFIATFFNVCVVYTTKTRFEGGDATFMDSLNFATRTLSLIIQWSLVSATVGILLHALDRLAQKLGGTGEIVMSIIRGLVGMAWSIATIFVIPVLVYEGLSPVAAIGRSTEILKDTWGESLVRHYGLGLIHFLVTMLGILFAVALGILLPQAIGSFIAVSFAVIWVIGSILVFNVANTVFNTALFVYASRGEEPASFDQSTLDAVFQRTD